MKKLKIETKSDNNFIGAWQSENLDLMDQIIEFFESILAPAPSPKRIFLETVRCGKRLFS